jgi:hypothetical protein
MKHRIVLLSWLLLLPLGCDREPSRTQTKVTTEDGRKAATTEQADAGKERAKLQVDLDQMQKELDDLKARAQKASKEARDKMQPTIDDLAKRTETARQRFNELGRQGADAWHAARPDLDRAMDTLRDAFRKAADQFKR